jgi:hypothetical protein
MEASKHTFWFLPETVVFLKSMGERSFDAAVQRCIENEMRARANEGVVAELAQIKISTRTELSEGYKAVADATKTLDLVREQIGQDDK